MIERKKQLLDAIAAAFDRYPDMRLGQLVINVSGSRDPWEVWDEDMTLRLRAFVELSQQLRKP